MKKFIILVLVLVIFVSCWKLEEIKTIENQPVGQKQTIETKSSESNSWKINITNLINIGSLWSLIYKDKDNKYLYFQDLWWTYKVMNQWTSKVMNWIDVKSFVIITKDIDITDSKKSYNGNINYAKDKNYIYHYVGAFYSNELPLNILKWVDSSTFQIIKCWDIFWCYIKDKNGIYFDWEQFLSIWWVNISSFEVFPDAFLYAKDKEAVYFKWKIIPWANPNTFKILLYISTGSNFWSDNKNIYCDNQICFPWVDIKTFQLFWWDTLFAKDKNHVYRNKNWGILKWADTNTFELTQTWAKDKNNFYDSNWEIITNIQK